MGAVGTSVRKDVVFRGGARDLSGTEADFCSGGGGKEGGELVEGGK